MIEVIGAHIDGRDIPAASGKTFDKFGPADGRLLWRAARCGADDADAAVKAARKAQPAWAATPPPVRGDILFKLAGLLEAEASAMAQTVRAETGKSMKDALGETMGAVALGRFMAGEGRRLYGRTTTSAMHNRQAMTLRTPVGVAALIVAANTPIANVAWKVFPALICGNAAVLKAAEDTPKTAAFFAALAARAGLPPGVLNILQGLGPEAGAALVDHPDVDIISFTGSTKVGRGIMESAGPRLVRVFLELGGKNPLVVCDDADLDLAARWAALSAFSNAGQRCASAGRIIVFDGVYEAFREKFLALARTQKLGTADDDDFGPVINERQLANMLAALDKARELGATMACGGYRLDSPEHASGCFMAPTVVEGAMPEHPISREELFGPITCLYRARDFEHALALANDSPYGLTACAHTASIHRANEFASRVQAGVVIINAGTYGSEPHMPFGGLKQSGNGLREPGTEALDVYSEWRTVYIHHEPGKA